MNTQIQIYIHMNTQTHEHANTDIHMNTKAHEHPTT